MDDGSAAESGGVVALVRDLIFASRIRGAAGAAGDIVTVRTAEEAYARASALDARLVLIDLDVRAADPPALIERIKTDAATAGATVVAFGSHVEREALDAARRAGADHVFPRSRFVRELPALLQGTDVAES